MSDSASSNTADELNSKLSNAGRPTITDKRSSKEVSEADIAAYKCPFCGYTAGSEKMVRGHITYENDSDHKDRNGYLDQIFVHAIDDDGNILADANTDFSEPERRRGEVTTEMVGEDITDKQAMILEIAIQNPGLSHQQVQKRCKERFDYEPADSYVGKVRSQYLKYQPPTDDDGKPQKKYDDLTEVQQRIVDEVVKFDDPLDYESWPVTQTEVGKRADCHATNIKPTLNRYGDLIRHRKARLDARSERRGGVRRTKPTLVNPDGPDSESDSESEPTEEDSQDYIQVSKEEMRKFATELDTLKRTATNQKDVSPRDSPMRMHANGKIEIVERVERFIKNVASENAGDDA